MTNIQAEALLKRLKELRPAEVLKRSIKASQEYGSWLVECRRMHVRTIENGDIYSAYDDGYNAALDDVEKLLNQPYRGEKKK